MYGVLAGLLIGLIVAAAVAFYVTKAPMPFVDRATRQPDQGKLPDPRNAPDPNQGLYGRDGAAGTPPTGPTATAPSPLPGVTPGAPSRQPDDLGALIATLPNLDRAPAPAATPAPAAKSAAGRPRGQRNAGRAGIRHLFPAGRRLSGARRRRSPAGAHHPAGIAGGHAARRSQRRTGQPGARRSIRTPGRHESRPQQAGRERHQIRGGATMNRHGTSPRHPQSVTL